MLKVLSMGWGVQSWTMAAMIALGELPPVDFIVHSDTGWERKSTYEFANQWGDWLKERGQNLVTLAPPPRSARVLEDNKIVSIPAYTLSNMGVGQLKRQCTSDWKVDPIKRFVRSVLKERGLKASLNSVEMQLGITTDEFVRAKDSRTGYIKNSYPLLDANMSRNDCVSWLESKGLPVPPKSSCTFCPFHSMDTWRAMKRKGGDDWQQVIAVDKAIRNKRPPRKVYLVKQVIPIDEIVIPEDFGMTQSSFLNDDDVTCDSGYCFM